MFEFQPVNVPYHLFEQLLKQIQSVSQPQGFPWWGETGGSPITTLSPSIKALSPPQKVPENNREKNSLFKNPPISQPPQENPEPDNAYLQFNCSIKSHAKIFYHLTGV